MTLVPRTLLVGPGPRADRVWELVGATSGTLPATRLGDVADLLVQRPGAARVLLDVDALPLEDWGLLRRALARGGLEPWLVGDDPGAPVARRLLAAGGARWLPWPLDVDALAELVGGQSRGDVRAPARGAAPSERMPEARAVPPPPISTPRAAAPKTSPPQHAPRPPAGAHEEEELAVIAELLSAPPPEGSRRPPFEEAPFEEAPFEEPPAHESPVRAADPSAGVPTGTPADSPARALPTFYREQVADLADIAQRVRLTLGAVDSQGAPRPGTDLAALQDEVARLQQFTRTLGYLAAPPARGEQELELATLLEEQLAVLAGASHEVPRILFRGERELYVQSDKTLLVQAFDALLQLAASCGGEGDVIRVSVEPDATGHTARARIGFPRGPLRGLDPEDIVEPYALKSRLPGIGPNALAAAGGILRGQGGDLHLAPDGEARLAFEVRLPLSRTSAAAGNGHGYDDPFSTP